MTPDINPFRTTALDNIPYFFEKGDSFDQLYSDFREQSFCGAICGEQGRGKTRLMELFMEYLCEKGNSVEYIKLSLESKEFSYSSIDNLFLENEDLILFFDGCEQLTPLQWFFFKRKIKRFSGKILISTHKEGRLPTLRFCDSSFELLKKIVEYLMKSTDLYVDNDLLKKLYKERNENIREVLLDLYDYFSSVAS